MLAALLLALSVAPSAGASHRCQSHVLPGGFQLGACAAASHAGEGDTWSWATHSPVRLVLLHYEGTDMSATHANAQQTRSAYETPTAGERRSGSEAYAQTYVREGGVAELYATGRAWQEEIEFRFGEDTYHYAATGFVASAAYDAPDVFLTYV